MHLNIKNSIINRNTIKWKIFKSNINIILIFIFLTALAFNISIKLYIERDLISQLDKIASSAEYATLKHGPDFFSRDDMPPPPDDPDKRLDSEKAPNINDPFKYYFIVDKALKDPLTILNADFILLDKNKNWINPFSDKSSSLSIELNNKINYSLDNGLNIDSEKNLKLNINGKKFIAVIRPVSNKNSFGLGWIVIYSNIDKINQLQLYINLILFLTLIIAALIAIIFSSRISKKISDPFSELNEYIKTISDRNFGEKITMPVYNELKDLIKNINIMSGKLESYDYAQKTFLQNISHEFRTPLMSIQSYAEGIKYKVIDSNKGVDIIVSEVKRITKLVEDLLYLSRLDAIEESYDYKELYLTEILSDSIIQISFIAEKNNIYIEKNIEKTSIKIYCDKEKLCRGLTNILSNCLRYTKDNIKISTELINNEKVKIIISDNGPGFNESELPNIFDRFQKGSNGNFGLGLSITKSIIDKLSGEISAYNSNIGAVFTIILPIVKENR